MTSGTAARRLTARQDKLADVRDQQAAAALRRRRLGLGAWMVGLLVIAGLGTAALLSSRPVQSSAARVAPDFSLPTSVGGTLRLSSLRGAPVLLYFSEGAGCDACLVQMAEIEKNPGFAKAGIRVVPIVMNVRARSTPTRNVWAFKPPSCWTAARCRRPTGRSVRPVGLRHRAAVQQEGGLNAQTFRVGVDLARTV